MKCFFTSTFEVYRLSSASDKESYSLNGEIRGYMTSLSAEDVMITNGNPAQSFKLITDFRSDIEKTDKITKDDVDYIVVGVQTFGFGAMRRKEVILEQFNS